MMKALKIMAIIAAVFLMAAVPFASASAYDGYNTIGNYQQYKIAYQGNYQYTPGIANGGPISLPNPYYNYATTPRSGGWFGMGGWTTGLRAPTYNCVAPTHYGNFYRPSCGGGTGGGGSQYSGASAPVRVRYGAGV